MKNNKGFTLIEILLVVVIIGALAAMVVPRLAGRSEQAKIAIAKVDIQSNIASALKLYELDNGAFPTSSQSLDALLHKPSASPAPPNWNGPYLEKEPLDPWGRKYQYACPGAHGVDYDLYSYGPRVKDEKGWITNWVTQAPAAAS
jgi:general secretion pathway protein G